MTETERYYEKMTQTPVSKLIFRLGIPTTISMLITNIYNLADTYFVGTLGESAQGATGILFTLQAIIQAIAFMLGQGCGSFVSKSLAEKDGKSATRYFSTTFTTGFLFGTVLMILGLIFLDPFMLLLGSTDTILPYARDYGFWVLISAPFMITSLIINTNLRYEGKAFYAMFGLTTGGILNILGDYILINICDLGVWGAGLSTAVSQIVSFTILVILSERMAQSRFSLRAISRKPALILSVMRVGLPSLLRQGLSSLSNGILNNLAKPFGDAAIAALSVISKYSMFAMCVGLGIGQGYQPVSSFNYQAKRYDRVKKGLVFTTVFGCIFVGFLALLGFVFAEQIVYIFQKSPDVLEIGRRGLRFAALGLVFQATFVPVNMLYQSIRRSGVSSYLSILRSGAVLIPVLFVLSMLFDLDGILLAQPVSDVITALLTLPFTISFLRATPEQLERQKQVD